MWRAIEIMKSNEHNFDTLNDDEIDFNALSDSTLTLLRRFATQTSCDQDSRYENSPITSTKNTQSGDEKSTNTESETHSVEINIDSLIGHMSSIALNDQVEREGAFNNATSIPKPTVEKYSHDSMNVGADSLLGIFSTLSINENNCRAVAAMSGKIDENNSSEWIEHEHIIDNISFKNWTNQRGIVVVEMVQNEWRKETLFFTVEMWNLANDIFSGISFSNDILIGNSGAVAAVSGKIDENSSSDLAKHSIDSISFENWPNQHGIVAVELMQNEWEKETIFFTDEMWCHFNDIMRNKWGRLLRAAGDHISDINSVAELFSNKWFRGERPIKRTSLIWGFTKDSSIESVGIESSIASLKESDNGSVRDSSNDSTFYESSFKSDDTSSVESRCETSVESIDVTCVEESSDSLNYFETLSPTALDAQLISLYKKNI